MKASELALRIAAALPREDRARLALLLLEGEAEEITFRRGGTRWTAFPWDHFISEVLFVHGSFQAPELRALLAWLTCRRFFAAPRDVVIDLGANIGTSTIPIAQHTGCRVVAVEPVPEIFAVLCRNVADKSYLCPSRDKQSNFGACPDDPAGKATVAAARSVARVRSRGLRGSCVYAVLWTCLRSD